jgi:thiol-disulfide isomerase/thioredoxin
MLTWLLARPSAAEPAERERPMRASDSGDELLGRSASEWRVDHWLNSKPLSLAALRGQVVLVRWWTAPDCPFCAATAPSLNEFDAQYRARGLRVIGFYHHKAESPLNPADVAHYVKTFHFEFPIAIDPDWTTLKSWWLAQGKRPFTSVSFLLDRHGVIRHIHPGGQFVKGDAGYAKLQASIEQLLAEPK